MRKFFFLFLVLSASVCAEDKTALCAACHGITGISANPQWPNLAGQHPVYFKKQWTDMKLGLHRHPGLMSSVLAAVSNQELDDLAVYYAKMPVAKVTPPKQLVARGGQLYRSGDRNKHIIACIACHGPKGYGNAQAGFPRLAGQHASYIMAQLTAFKEKKRSNDLHQIMQNISSQMSQEDIEALAHYIEGLN